MDILAYVFSVIGILTITSTTLGLYVVIPVIRNIPNNYEFSNEYIADLFWYIPITGWLLFYRKELVRGNIKKALKKKIFVINTVKVGKTQIIACPNCHNTFFIDKAEIKECSKCKVDVQLVDKTGLLYYGSNSML